MFCHEIGSKTTLYDDICVPVFYDKSKKHEHQQNNRNLFIP